MLAMFRAVNRIKPYFDFMPVLNNNRRIAVDDVFNFNFRKVFYLRFCINRILRIRSMGTLDLGFLVIMDWFL
jgi:hypothetical protein